jgi:hypothetical protein
MYLRLLNGSWAVNEGELMGKDGGKAAVFKTGACYARKSGSLMLMRRPDEISAEFFRSRSILIETRNPKAR